MRRYLIPIILGLICLLAPQASKAQSTTVNATITDGAGQVLAGGTYKFSSTATGQVPIGGSLDSGGSFSGVSIPHTPATAIVDDYWTVTICPDATFACGTSFIKITGPTLNLSSLISPISTISIAIPGPPSPITSLRAYSDNEISSTPKGGSYFNVLTNVVRTCTTLNGNPAGPNAVGTCTAWASSSGSGGSVGPGTTNFISCFNATTTIANCPDGITDIAGIVNIPANVTLGNGIGTTSFGMASGPVSGCLNPQVGVNFICSDGDLNTIDASLNGQPYVPLATTNSSSQIFNVLLYGAVCDGRHIAADTAAIKAAITAAGLVQGVVFFPHDTNCEFDTAAAAYPISNWSGTIQGEGYTSVLTSNNDTNSMLDFRYPVNLTIKDMHFQQTPSGFLTNGFPVNIDSGINILISHNYSNDGNTGWRIGNSYHVRFEGNSCSNMHGNCLFAPNDNDIHTVNTASFNDGDTAEEFSRWHFETSPTCQQVTSTGLTSYNDGTGIIVDSCTDVAISDFAIYTNGGGAQGAIFIGQDHNTTTDHYPSRVQLSNGVIYGASYSNGNINQNQNIAAININTTDAISEAFDVNLANIKIEHSSAVGLKVVDPNNVINLTTSNLWMHDVGNGMNLGAGSPQGEGIYFSGGKSLKTTNTYIENPFGRCIQLIGGNSTVYTELNNFTCVNPMQGGTGTTVASIYNRNTGGTFLANGVTLIDTWGTANRSTIIDQNTSGVHSISNVSSTCTVTCGAPTFSAVATPPRYFGMDMSQSTNPAAFRMPNIAGATTTTNGTAVYDTTNKNIHMGANGVDNLNVVVPSSVTVTNTDCAQWSVVAGVVTLNDSGSGCGGGGGGVTGCTSNCNYVLGLGDSIIAPINSSAVMTGNNVPNLVQFYNAASRKLGNVTVRVTVLGASGHFDVGVYSVSGTTGTLQWHTGSLSTNVVTNLTATPTPFTLAAGTTYLYAWCADNTTAQIGAISPSTVTGSMAVTGAPAHTWGVDTTDVCTAGVLPNTVTTTNIANNQNASVPYALISN